MGSKTFRGYKRELASLYVTCILISLALGTSNGSVVVIRGDISLSFDDLEANFAPSVKESGVCGVLYLADPLDACSPLTNRVIEQQGEGLNSSFALIIRGGCTFTDKVRRAQNAGFKAAIVYDNEDGGSLVSMAGNSVGIKIHAVFISKAAGEKLKTYAGTVLWIIPMFENSAWSVMAISFISLLAMAAVIATCFFVRRHSIRRQRSQVPLDVHEFHGMSNRSVRALPSLVYTSILEDNCTSRTCAICLEDYAIGEKLRILPCLHKFHTICVDSWLTTWRTFCPMCKHDARARTGNPPASESTPLLSSTPSSSQSPVHSSLSSTTSSAIQIAPLGSSRSCINSLSSTPYVSYSLSSSYRDSPAMSISRSSIDLRNASFHRSHTNLATSQSIGCRFSPLDSRYGSPCILSSTNASPGHGGSCSHHQYLLNYDSAASISPTVSAQSLPGC